MEVQLALLALIVLAAGCSSPEPIPEVVLPSPVQGVTTDSQGDTKPITLKIVDAKGYEAEVASHLGKIVVVDFWATWCEPCKERFPHMVKLAAQFAPEDVAFLSVSLDQLDDKQKAVDFLKEARAGLLSNLLTELDATTAFDAYDIRAGIPNYKLYDRQGKLRHQFALLADEKLELLAADDLDSKVHELLIEPKQAE